MVSGNDMTKFDIIKNAVNRHEIRRCNKLSYTSHALLVLILFCYENNRLESPMKKNRSKISSISFQTKEVSEIDLLANTWPKQCAAFYSFIVKETIPLFGLS